MAAPAVRYQVSTVTVALSAQVSATFNTVGRFPTGLWVPTVDSCAAFLQVSPDTTSANFVRELNPPGSGDWTAAIGPGSRAVSLMGQESEMIFPYARIELGVPQTAARQLVVVYKLR